jgi:Uma2 family endonuclease
MSAPAKPAPFPAVVYPDSDGTPMADNTRQFRWIGTLYGNLAALFHDRADVFVSGNQFWYPVEGEPSVCTAPDVYVVFGRPKGDRGSYKQWEEGGVPMTVVFEVLSPDNRFPEMADKHAFYDDYGAEEYYIYDPDAGTLRGWVRRGSVLLRVQKTHGFVSPRLGIRFDLSGPEMVVYHPDGRRFLTFEQLEEERARLGAENARLEEERERLGAENVRLGAEREQAVQSLARIAALSRKALLQQATPEEAAELERLLKEAPGA